MLQAEPAINFLGPCPRARANAYEWRGAPSAFWTAWSVACHRPTKEPLAHATADMRKKLNTMVKEDPQNQLYREAR